MIPFPWSGLIDVPFGNGRQWGELQAVIAASMLWRRLRVDERVHGLSTGTITACQGGLQEVRLSCPVNSILKLSAVARLALSR